MEIRIFDVEHGFCSYIISDNGNVILIDCGHNDTTGFRPSEYLPRNRCTGIEQLIISNYDEDHISDLPNLLAALPVQVLSRNRLIDVPTLRNLKAQSGPISPAMTAFLRIHGEYTEPVTNPPLFTNLEILQFYNDYPTFTDTNNLSLITFIFYFNFGIIYPGDIEKPGWMRLLGDVNFRNALNRMNVFIASHHGRESGYCAEVFDYCYPDIAIISDTRIQYQTQEISYRSHVKGIPWSDGNNRFVLTTRSDGMIQITKNELNPYHILTSR